MNTPPPNPPASPASAAMTPTASLVRHEPVAGMARGLFVDCPRLLLVNREQLDYTEWRKRQWLDETVSTLAEKARLLRAANPDR